MPEIRGGRDRRLPDARPGTYLDDAAKPFRPEHEARRAGEVARTVPDARGAKRAALASRKLKRGGALFWRLGLEDGKRAALVAEAPVDEFGFRRRGGESDGFEKAVELQRGHASGRHDG